GVVLSIHRQDSGEVTERRYSLSMLAAAIVNYCLTMRVPIPRNCTKSIQVLTDGVALVLENTVMLQTRHEELSTLAAGTVRPLTPKAADPAPDVKPVSPDAPSDGKSAVSEVAPMPGRQRRRLRPRREQQPRRARLMRNRQARTSHPTHSHEQPRTLTPAQIRQLRGDRSCSASSAERCAWGGLLGARQVQSAEESGDEQQRSNGVTPQQASGRRNQPGPELQDRDGRSDAAESRVRASRGMRSLLDQGTGL